MTTKPTNTTTKARKNLKTARREGRAADIGVVLLAFGVAAVMLYGSRTMNVRGQQVPGPQFFPYIVAGLLIVMGIVLLAQMLRSTYRPEELDHNPNISADLVEDIYELGELGPVEFIEYITEDPADPDAIEVDEEVVETTDPETARAIDWRTFGLTVGAVALFIVALDPLGWIISAALLFWIIAYAFGSKRPIFDIGVALMISGLVQLLFSGVLGLSLPAGFVGGLF